MFAKNPMCSPLPSSPRIAPQSTAWVALQAQPGHAAQFADLSIAASGHDDASEPVYDASAPSPNDVALPLVCDGSPWAGWSCKTFHAPEFVTLPPGAKIEGNEDGHLSLLTATAEIDLWAAHIAQDGMHVGGAGSCAYGGDGTNCSGATATNIATSLGGIDPATLAAVESDPHGVLPYAIAFTALCAAHEFVYPATASDGSNTDAFPACKGHLGALQRPPVGARFFLDLSDDAIDAMSNPPYAKALLRTIDREHFGGTIVDTNWYGAAGLAVQYRRGDWAPFEREAGVAVSDNVRLPFSTRGIDLRKSLRFCASGDCR